MSGKGGKKGCKLENNVTNSRELKVIDEGENAFFHREKKRGHSTKKGGKNKRIKDGRAS